MSRSEIITLVDDFSLGVSDATEVGVLYDEVVRELGFLEVLTSREDQVVVAGQGTVTLAVDTIRSLEIYSSEVGKLDRTTAQAMQAVLGNSWRSERGTTVAYVQDQENDNTVRLVPVPDAGMVVSVIRTDARLDVPVWLELAVAMEVLSREMGRESGHQDVMFAGAAAQVGRFLFGLLGVDFGSVVRERR